MKLWHTTLERKPEMVEVEAITDDANMKGYVWIYGRHAVPACTMFTSEHAVLDARRKLLASEIDKLEAEKSAIDSQIEALELAGQETV